VVKPNGMADNFMGKSISAITEHVGFHLLSLLGSPQLDSTLGKDFSKEWGMSGTNPIIVVTGGNRGIGFEICRQLASRGAQVVLTARKPEAGEQAVKKLAAHSLSARFHPLNVTGPESIAALRDFLERTFGRLDVLISNAGIISDEEASGLEVKLSTLRATLETNTLAPLHVAQTLAPLLKRSVAGRIVNMSSGMGALSEMEGGYAAYRISKVALNAVTRILAAKLGGAVAVNSMCPGWVRTDMGGANAERDVSQGADTAVWLALDAPQDLTGKFLRDRKVIAW
jgi:NAD(P)-dependent dehydrogenase (short-subunit alcohol dehydrogenase family)